jgi:hypothetical protein
MAKVAGAAGHWPAPVGERSSSVPALLGRLFHGILAAEAAPIRRGLTPPVRLSATLAATRWT